VEEDLDKTKKTKAVPEDLFPDLPSEYQDGRDELNLAEFPDFSNRKQVRPER